VDEFALHSWLGPPAVGDNHPMVGSALLELILDIVDASVFVIDEGGSVVLANRRGTALMKRNGEELSSFLRTGTSGPNGSTLAELGAWSRGSLRAWRRWFIGDGGERYAFVVVDSEDALVEGVLEVATRSWSLTSRQVEVLRLVLAGQSTKEIASALGAATRTIDVHLKALFEKANVTGRAALVSKAWKLERPGRLRP
jgi:DNA-binding CsgD family transcriptional regulator